MTHCICSMFQNVPISYLKIGKASEKFLLRVRHEYLCKMSNNKVNNDAPDF